MAKPRSTVVPDHVTQNIEAVANLRALSKSEFPNGQRAVESLTLELGRQHTTEVVMNWNVVEWTSALKQPDNLIRKDRLDHELVETCLPRRSAGGFVCTKRYCPYGGALRKTSSGLSPSFRIVS